MEGERKKSMYRKDSEGWLKHTDFIILDMICLQLAYVLAYAISGYGFNPYETIIYRNMAVFLELADLVMIFAYGTMKSVLKRGYYRDFVVTLNHAIVLKKVCNYWIVDLITVFVLSILIPCIVSSFMKKYFNTMYCVIFGKGVGLRELEWKRLKKGGLL